MANAAFSSLISQAAISMINNQGDIGAVMKDMGSDEYLKSLAISVATAGAGEYADQFTGSWSNSLASSTGMSQGIANSVVRVGTKTLISSTLQSSIYGTNFGEALTDNLIRNSAYAVGAEAAHTIGDWNEAYNLNDFEHLALHGMLGCAIGAISDNCGNGALGAVLGEFTAERTGNANFGRVAGAIGVALAGGDAEGIYVGFDTADNAVTNNYLSHSQLVEAERRLKNCDKGGETCSDVIKEYQYLSNFQDLMILGGATVATAGLGDTQVAAWLAAADAAQWAYLMTFLGGAYIAGNGNMVYGTNSLVDSTVTGMQNSAGAVFNAEPGLDTRSSIPSLTIIDSRTGQPIPGDVLSMLMLGAPYVEGMFGGRSLVSSQAVTSRVFRSNDPLVGALATKIDSIYPGHVVGVNVPVYNPITGQLVTDADIVLRNSIVQVKSGGGKGLTSQLIRTENSTGLTTIGYGPDLKPSVIQGAQKSGCLVTNCESDLLKVIRP